MKQSPRRLDLRCPVSASINHEEIAAERAVELVVVVGLRGGHMLEWLQMQELCGGWLWQPETTEANGKMEGK